MKPAIVSIFSLLLTAGLAAECKALIHTTGSDTFWKHFSDKFGHLPFPKELEVCTGKKYFFEIKGGARMQSALDRQKRRILRRADKLVPLMHEMAHVYLDLRWRILPYSVSEPFVLAMANTEPCPGPIVAKTTLAERWRERSQLSRCELLLLLSDVLKADVSARDRLPLN